MTSLSRHQEIDIMKGINHIITGVSTAIAIDTLFRAISFEAGDMVYNTVCSAASWRFITNVQSSFENTVIGILVIFVNVVMFILGCLLPDCDQERSIAGRMLYVPVQHRTWTHTIWCVVIFFLMGIAAPCFLWLAYGYTLHIFYDSLSKGGICWFYPISGYKKWASGAQVKKNHKIYLYRTGETSETILTILVSLVGLSMLIYAIHLTVTHGTLPFHAEWLFGVDPV